MCNISQSCDQTFDVKCSSRSEVIDLGTPKRVVREKTKAHADTAAKVHKGEFLPSNLVVQAGFYPASDVVEEPTPDKPRRHKTPIGKPPTVGNVVQVHKNVFMEFCWDNGVKNSSGNMPTRH
jgi:hypothetical protein